MAFSLNKHMIIGNIGKDPETRYTANGDAVINFSVATSERYKDKNGEQQENTEWHNVTAWRKAAEILSEHASKGKKIFVEGPSKTRKWQDKDGNDHYTTEVTVREFIIFDNQGAPAATSGGKAKSPKVDNNIDDDIPF